MAYEAIVTRIHTRPHPNADRLQLGTVHGHQVVVGLETQDGELGIFFPTDGQLSDSMCRCNSLYAFEAYAKLGEESPYPKEKCGFFSANRRVRAQSFRGEKSDGFWCPLSFLAWTNPADYLEGSLLALKEGDTFTAFNGQEICCKYETPATKRAQGKIGGKQRENHCFPKHDVTKQFRYVSETIPEDAVIYITEKLHGTSGRYGYVLDDVALPWWKQLFNRFGSIFPEQQYRYLNGSKNVILEKSTGGGYYGTNEFRYNAIEGVELHKGEVLYFEIIGEFVRERTWIDVNGKEVKESYTVAIMPPHPIKSEMKDVRKAYGEQMRYRYGLDDGQTDIYVYKIVRMNEDGIGVDLSWPQVVARCSELGLKHVPLLAGPFSLSVRYPSHWDDGVYYADPVIRSYEIEKEVNDLTEGKSTLDVSHIREGIVLRVESSRGIEYIKNKSWLFGVLEGYIKDNTEYVDMEEIS